MSIRPSLNLPKLAVLRASALRSATVLRDCSLRAQSSRDERRACRTLMREQAAQWRQPTAAAW